MLANPRSDRIQAVRALTKRSVRARTGRFVVEGPQGVREAVRHAPERVVDVYATVASARRYADDIIEPARAAGLYVHEATDEVVAAMGDADSPQGVLAVVSDASPSLDEVLAAEPGLLVLLAHVRDPGNLGTVIRAADAMGADAVLVSQSSVDVTSPKVVRSTAGSLFHLPIVRGLPVESTLHRLRAAGIRSLAADGHGTRQLPDVDLTGAHCWVMGNEAWGLSEELRAACDAVVRVPIHGPAESLNLAMAATICLYASADARHHGDTRDPTRGTDTA
ncbi:RNA methyltransferase [Nostocoides sp. F2B08]|uniref:TrmH family RNA methyltransferase n=1 Tax=Nostocoides sp. F2B08 TaxID=2653936 RepID=UPI00186B45F0|nr:RNA methyltransferase [Tetrasphaera sp. F2B08]